MASNAETKNQLNVFILKASPASANEKMIIAWKKRQSELQLIPGHSNPKTDCSIEFLIPKNP